MTVVERINPALEKLAVPLKVLRSDPENARRHEQRSIDAIKQSLAEYGQQKPIVVLTDGTVVAGNGTLEAAKQLGWGRLAVVKFDDPKKAKAFALMDNRSAELSGWDEAQLARTLEELAATGDWRAELVGFTQEEMDQLVLGGAPLPGGGVAREYDESTADGAPPPPPPKGEVSCPGCGHRFTP